jgi:hypothetical protein
MRDKYETIIDDLKSTLDHHQEEAKHTIQTLEQQLSDQNLLNKSLDFRLTDITRQLQLTEQDRLKYLDETQTLNTQIAKLDAQIVKLESQIITQTHGNNSLSLQLQEKVNIIENYLTMHRVYEDNQVNHKDKCIAYEERLMSCLDKINKLEGEVSLKEEECKKLLQECRMLKEKIKVKSEVIRREVSL